MRRTRRRAAVLETLGSRAEFVSAQELHALLAVSGRAVGLTTVYRALRELDRAGLVDVVRDETGERLYLRRPTDEHRHYLICRDCGRSRPVDAGAVEVWADGLAEATGFAELEHTLELSLFFMVSGVCGSCRSAQLCTPRPDRPGASSGRSTRSSS
ncbi:transcriptional repressor [Streptomyces sp. Je 1-369]|nr:transcriptional repressor [Streptomyces sp. Je 1-369]